MAVYLHGVAVVRQELNMDVGRKAITGNAFLTSLSPARFGFVANKAALEQDQGNAHTSSSMQANIDQGSKQECPDEA